MSQKLVNELKTEISESMKAHDPIITITLRSILAEAQSIALKDGRKELVDSDIISSAIKCVKEGSEGIEIYKNLEGKVAEGNYIRNARLKSFAEHYLPIQLTKDEIVRYVSKSISLTNATSMKDMGAVMKHFKSEHLTGTFDTKLVSAEVRRKLG